MVGHQITCVQACVARQTFQMAGQVSNRRYLGIAEQLPQQALMAVHPQMNPAASDGAVEEFVWVKPGEILVSSPCPAALAGRTPDQPL